MNLDKLLASNMFTGTFSYPSQREKPWHGFLYLARTGKNIKVGYTNYDIGRRSGELKREDIDAVFYSWSSPNPQVLEKYVKERLREFSVIEKVPKYQYEIFANLPWTVMIYTIRLIILWVHLKERWVIDEKDYYKKVAKYFDGVTFNTIQFQDVTYKGRDVPKFPMYKKNTRVLAYWDKKDTEEFDEEESDEEESDEEESGEEESGEEESDEEEIEYENGWYEAKIIKHGLYAPKGSPKGTKKEPAYQIKWDVTKGTVWLLASRIKPLFPEVDVKRILRLEEAYKDLGIEIETVSKLKF